MDGRDKDPSDPGVGGAHTSDRVVILSWTYKLLSFISGYSNKGAPVTELLKKNNSWCQKAFEGLKVAVTEEPVLTLPDFSKTFKLHTDASNFATGGINSEGGRKVF
uniref:Reverse transcriptase/retrotransposon-derived protein RNase H-like domain-containing protein n=1 Tax=Solanum lycopersicum TaxID=4081 RepID=A0A3Q7EXD2_SOLLC